MDMTTVTNWRKTNRSGPDADCVQAKVTWQKSSKSGNGGNCVECAGESV